MQTFLVQESMLKSEKFKQKPQSDSKLIVNSQPCCYCQVSRKNCSLLFLSRIHENKQPIGISPSPETEVKTETKVTNNGYCYGCPYWDYSLFIKPKWGRESHAFCSKNIPEFRALFFIPYCFIFGRMLKKFDFDIYFLFLICTTNIHTKLFRI